jgi:hypothetical protein
MQTSYPVVPLFDHMGVSVGLFSYNGGLFWGLNADWEHIPDLHDFVVALESGFRELQEAAEAERDKPRDRELAGLEDHRLISRWQSAT